MAVFFPVGDMELFGSFLGGLALLIVANMLVRGARSLRRRRSAALPSGEAQVHAQAGLPARIFVNQRLPGGLKPRVINRDRVDLLLSERRLLLCSGAGRIVEINHETPGSVKAVGPDRLVIEGSHPSGRGAVRVELVAASARDWVARTAEVGLQGASSRQMP